MTDIAAAAPTAPSSGSRALAELALVAATFIGGRFLIDTTGFRFAGPAAILLALIVATLLLRRCGESWRGLGLYLPTATRQWVMLPVLTIAAMATTFLLAVVLLPALSGIDPDQSAGAAAFDFLRESPIVFFAFLLFIAWGTAAFGEEMLFRGFLQSRLEALFGGGGLAVGAALIGQAILFGFGHGYQGWFGIVLTGLIGLAMGIVYLAGRRWLAPVIIAHGLIDTISLSQIYASG